MNSKIIDMNEVKNKTVTADELKELSSVMENVAGQANIMESIASLLALPDEQFIVLAPGILDAFQRSMNNASDKIMMVQALNASGAKVENLREAFIVLSDEIDKNNEYSAPKRDFMKQLLNNLLNAVSDTEGVGKKYVQIPFEKCNEGARVPEYAHTSDSGMDVYALDDYTIHPGETKLIPTGIKVAIPHGYELQVRPKSGRALKTKLRIANTPGTIDAGYRDEIGVIVENIESPIKDIIYDFDDSGRPIITSILHGSDFHIGKGEKFAQLVLMEVPKANFYRVEKVSEIGEDRRGGFGSTGLK